MLFEYVLIIFKIFIIFFLFSKTIDSVFDVVVIDLYLGI